MYKLVISGMVVAVLGVALAQTPNSEKSKDQATKLVTEPQQAVILTNAGVQMRAILVSLDSKELQYKLRQTDKTPRKVTAKSGQIRAVQIGSGDMFAVNPKTKAFEPYDPATGTFTAAKQNAKSNESSTGQEVGESKGEKAQSEKVVAEGVGTTADEALKDAFRNAVRQVVGADVDAETLLKNDEVISDKVLTYSNGFINKYDEISKNQAKGLFRVKIAADVERRSVVAKLKAASITVRAVAGGSMFAKEITTAEAQKNAAALLRKGLQDLPGFLVASVVTKPEYDRRKSEVVFDVAIRVDRKAYGAWLKKMEAILEKVCLRRGSGLVGAELYQSSNDPVTGVLIGKCDAFAGPALTKTESGGWGIWVNTFNNGLHTITKWNWYVVDSDPQETLKGIRGQHLVTLSLQDADGELVTEDQFTLQPQGMQMPRGHFNIRKLFPLWQTVLRFKGGTSSEPMRHIDSYFAPNSKYDKYMDKLTPNRYISPYWFEVDGGYGDVNHYYMPQLTVNRRIRVNLDELKKIEKVACKVTYTE
jgi:hypothetical protein